MIVLVGFMAAGKTTVGRVLATRLGLPFVDTDALIERHAGASVATVFEQGGEAAFRELERDVVAEVLAGPDAVVALGGGALGDPGTCTALEWATVVHLDVSFTEALRRSGGTGDRPMLALGDPKALYDDRQSAYGRVADLRVATDGKTPGEVADEVAAQVGAAKEAGPRRIGVSLGRRSYEVVVGTDLVANLRDYLPPLAGAEKAFFVTHPSLQDLASGAVSSLRDAGLEVHGLSFPEGEASKSLATAAGLYERLAELGAHRHDLIVGFGGGVVTDVAGFVASTYARGLSVAYVPTTLLAQVDAAIGGKTAVNLPQGKNLVGTIHQPVAVVCDVDLLDTLPDDELVSGLAEVVKHGLIADGDLLVYLGAHTKEILARDKEALTEIVARSVAVKASIVASDERDTGARAALNYGHTFAHAIEHSSGFGSFRHGEAVALGMMAAAYVARKLGRIDDEAVEIHRRVLAALGLPTSARLSLEELEGAWRLDKKYRHGVRFVLLAGVGKPEPGIAVERETLARALEELAR